PLGHKMLIFPFFLALTALILQSVLVPRVTVLAFAPFLAIATVRCGLNRVLWLAAFCGGILDLLSDDPMGLHALNYVLITAML
ncbi:hypothetical protein NL526_29320, partial [Klebsiella pneumoniae]|nr:hypothetical protein [Klebsiella pneumoniae]